MLNKDNYDTWCVQAEALLIKNDGWDYANGIRKRPETIDGDATSEIEARRWDIADQKAKSDLILTICPSELKQIKGCQTAHDVWEKLRSIYASKGPAKRAALLRRLTSHRIASNDDIREHIDKFIEIIDKLAMMDITIHKDLQSAMLLNSLPENYENFRCAIESRDDLPDLENLKIKILEEFETRHQKNIDEHGAMAAKSNQHKALKEFKKNKTEKEAYNSKKPNKFKCFECGKIGHRAADCYFKKKDNKHRAGKVSELFCIEENTDAFTITENSKQGYWCLDSGCTTHLCKDESKFIQMEPVNYEKLNLATNASAVVKASGNVGITTSLNDQTKQVEFSEVLYVPDLRTNLISVARITEKGNKVIFGRNEAVIIGRNGEMKLKARRVGNLYYVQEKKETAGNVSCPAIDNFQLWHERMGHLNARDLMNLVKNKRATGIHIKEESKAPICETCIQGKLTSTPFEKGNQQRSSNLLEIVHSDVCGPMSIESLGGSRYMVSFIDDYSRWTEIYFLKRKDEVFQAFKDFKSYAEKRTNLKIKYLQTDNGREYCNRRFEEFLKAEGIKRRLTVPHTPEQNGIAERKNRTLIDMARCMLLQARLSTGFWAEAVSTANYLRNRCPTKSLNGRTPFEIWMDRLPNLRHLRIFGMRAHILNKDPRKKKFDSRSKTGIFIGYSDSVKAYRIWIPNEKRVVVSRDIRVLENSSNDNNGLKEDNTAPDKTSTICISNTQSSDENGSDLSDNKREDSLDIPDNEEEQTEAAERCENLCRAPGRPRILRVGRKGRPRKLFHYRKIPDDNDQEDAEEEEGIEEVRSNTNPSEEYNFRTNIDHEANLVFTANMTEISVEKALNGNDQEEWRQAIKSEMKNLIKNDTFKIIERPTDKKVIGCRVVLTNKFKADGSLERRKARVVAKGFAQRPGVDFIESFAPVARLESVRLIMAMAAELSMSIEQIDITSAYLNGSLLEDTYMEKPDLLEECLEEIMNDKREEQRIRIIAKQLIKDLKDNDDTVCYLKKAIYGLKQAGRQWHDRLSKKLKEFNLKPTTSDPCIYHGKRENHVLYIVIYVDDMLIASTDPNWIKNVKLKLSKAFDMKDLGRANYCLGIEIQQDREKITLSQRRYILNLLNRYGMDSCNPITTPMDRDTVLDKSTADDRDERRPYRELVGALMYLAVATRPDIAHAVSVLSQFNDCNAAPHWRAAKRVLRYLKCTINYGIVFRKSGDSIRLYVDADWGRCKIDRRSYTGYVITLSEGPISWKSQKQRTVALSSTEAEYIALAEATKDGIYMCEFLKELGLSQFAKLSIYNDNTGAQLLAKNPIVHPRTKHIDIRFHFIREAIKRYSVNMCHVPSEQMPADVLTKPIVKEKHYFCIDAMGMRNIDI